MKLYSYWRSSSAYRVRIALYHLGLDFDYEAVHLVKDGGEQHTESFKKLNPQGEVPVLEDEGFIIRQSMAIFHYLHGKYGSLFPDVLEDRIRSFELCEVINSGIQPIQNLRVLQKLKEDFDCSEDQKVDWIRFWLQRGLSSFEALAKTPFSTGQDLSAADMFLIPQLYNARRFELDLSAYPKLQAIEANCSALKAFQLAHPDSQPDRP